MAEKQHHTILVIDDEAIIRRNFKGYLEDEGYRTLITDDGHEALEILEQERVDLILVDLRMPKMDGLEVLARVKQTLPETPVIVVSGTGRLEDAVEALRLGARDYLLKPVEDMSILSITIENALDRARLIRENREHQQQLEMLVAERTAELRTAIAKIEKNERFLNTIVENIPDMVFVKDSEDLRFVRFNKAGEYLLGYSRDELIGKCDHDIFPKQDADAFQEKDRLVLDRKILLDIAEERIQTRHKGERILHTKKIPITDEKGKPEYLLGISEDITDRKEAEKVTKTLESQLRQAQKMEAIGTLAGGIAHDFNNILSAIIGYTEMLQLSISTKSVEYGYADYIYQAGNRAKDLVQQILAFSRQTEHELIPVRMAVIVKEVIKLIRSSLPTTIDIRRSIHGDPLVMGDPTQIHQILMNLCTNAGHAMQDKGGVLGIGLKSIALTDDHADDRIHLKPGIYVELSVSDTGHGIRPEHINRVFDPFFSTKKHGEGTGLGLSVVHGIVESFGGSVHVYSEESQGSTFKVFIPSIERLTEKDERKEVEIPKGTEHVLFVDDEPVLVEMGKTQLEFLGYQVTCRSSSLECLDLFKAKPEHFDLVITDLTMPKMTGDRLAKKIKRIKPDIPVILCTGFSSKVTPESAHLFDIDALLMKPIILRELAEIIRNTIDKKSLNLDERL